MPNNRSSTEIEELIDGLLFLQTEQIEVTERIKAAVKEKEADTETKDSQDETKYQRPGLPTQDKN